MPKIHWKCSNDTNDHNMEAYADPNRRNASKSLFLSDNKAACNPTQSIAGRHSCRESRSLSLANNI